MSSLIPELKLYRLCCFQSSPFSDFSLALSWAGCLSLSTRRVCLLLVTLSTVTTPALEICGCNLNLNLGRSAHFLILLCRDAGALLGGTSPEFILSLSRKIVELKYPQRWNLLFSAIHILKSFWGRHFCRLMSGHLRTPKKEKKRGGLGELGAVSLIFIPH